MSTSSGLVLAQFAEQRVKRAQGQFAEATPNLSLLTSGPLPPDSPSLLLSVAMTTLLQQARAEYDYVLLNSSSLLGAIDGIGLASRVDAVLLMAQYGAVRIKRVQQSIERLNLPGINLSGLLVSAAPASDP